MCNKTYAKVLLVVMSMLDLGYGVLSNLWTLGCDRPTVWCKLFSFCLFVLNVACLVCICVELKNGNPRLYTPYYVYLCVRVVLTCVAFLVVLASLGSPTPELLCNECACKCPNLNDISPDARESVMQNARWILLFALFVQLCWDILTLTLIHLAVPDAMRLTRRREPLPIEDQNPAQV